jgi:hypothetical protein
MAFRQNTHTHTMDNNFAIGKGQLTGGNMYGSQAPSSVPQSPRQQSKPTLSQMKGLEGEQHAEEVLGGDASPYGS